MSAFDDDKCVWHAGVGPVHHLTDLKSLRPLNTQLTESIISICQNKNVSNQILFGTLQCRFLDQLLTKYHFTPKQLLKLAQRYTVIFPWSLVYDTYRLQANKRFQLFPLLIALPETPKQVAKFIHLAQQHGLPLSIRSGGHSAEGYASAGELVIDLSLLRLPSRTISHRGKLQMQVDTQNNLVRVSPGVPLGRFYTELIRHQRIASAGTCPAVAAGGLFLGGGIGTFDRKLGLACDNVVAIDIVLATGEAITATADNEHHKLFTALRGAGGGNFGVVTQLTVQIYPTPPFLLSFNFVWKATQKGVAKLMAEWHNRFLSTAPPSITTSELRMVTGINEVIINGFFWPDCPDRVIAYKQLKQLLEEHWLDCGGPQPQTITIQPVSTEQAVEMASGGDAQLQPFLKARSFFALQKIPTKGWRRILNFMAKEQPFASLQEGQGVLIWHGLGARSATNNPKLLATTVFPTRQAYSWCLDYTFWRLQADECQGLAFSQRMNAVLQPWLSELSYYNWQDNQLLTTDYLHRYFAEHVKLLRAVKAKYDPKHVFSFPLGITSNPAIPPTTCRE